MWIRPQSSGMSVFHQCRRLMMTNLPRSRKAPIKKDWPTDARGEEIRTAKARRLGINAGPRKLNLVAKLVRGLKIDEARRQLTGCKKKSSEVVMQAIDSAVTNARGFGLNVKRLVVHEAFVSKGKYLPRIRPWHGKGRYGIEHKKYSHLTVIVRELDEELWDARVLPQYVHMKFAPRERDPDREQNHPIHRSDKVSFHSQLDLSLNDTQTRISGLKELVAKELETEKLKGVHVQTSTK